VCRVYPVEGCYYTSWLTGLVSTQVKVDGIVLKAACHWVSDSSVANDAEACECGNEPLGSIKCGDFLD
jgi:hypothetical protein